MVKRKKKEFFKPENTKVKEKKSYSKEQCKHVLEEGSCFL